MIYAGNPSLDDSDQTVLLVEEDEVARSFLAENLEADRYGVRTADSREKALAILSVQQPDLIVVDVNGKTLDLIDAIRDGEGLAGRLDPDTPLIVLTTRVDELHRIRVLDRGGDDVLAKPYSYPELRARMAALLRRAQARRSPRMLRIGQLTIDLSARIAEVQGNRLELTAKEYELLRALAREPTRVLTRVNFEPRLAEGKGSEGFRARSGIGDPLSPGRLWPLDYRASRLLWVRQTEVSDLIRFGLNPHVNAGGVRQPGLNANRTGRVICDKSPDRPALTFGRSLTNRWTVTARSA